MLSREVSQFPTKLPGDRQGTLALQESDHRRHCILWRDLDTHVDMVRQQMAFHDPTLFLLGQLVKDPAQARADLSIEYLATIFGDEHHVILAFPSGVRQALPRRFRHTVLLRICQQAILGGLYSRNAQSCSSHPSRTRGLPPRSIYHALLSSILQSEGMAMDETPIKAGHPSKGKLPTGYFWPLSGDQDELAFPFAASRAGAVVREVLGAACGV